MDGFLEVMHADMLSDGEMTAVLLQGHDFLVARVGDEFFVTDERCPHLLAHLSNGTLEGTVLTCPLHGSQFDVTDGHVLRWTGWSGAAASIAAFVKHPRPLRSYEVVVRDGVVYVGAQKLPPTR